MNLFKNTILTIIIISFNQVFCQSKLSVHGHLSQAFAISDNHTVFGIPKEGTFDYRTLALQFRYDISDYNSTVVQFSHRRIGLSPLMTKESDIAIDWAFFEHRFNENFGVKLGKILIPFGLHNETRDVGVLNPFYRVPFVPYTMGSYLSETVDGISGYYNFKYDGEHDLEFEFYAGNWSWLAWFNNRFTNDQGFITIVDRTNVTDGLGSRILFNTPVEELDMIFSWQRGHAGGSLFFSRKYGGVRPQTYNAFNLSLDLDFGKIYMQPEYVYFYLQPGEFNIQGISGQFGYEFIENVSINFLVDMIKISDVPRYASETSNAITERRSTDYLKDYAVSTNYKFNANFVIKGELHFNRSLAIEEEFFDGFLDKPDDTIFSIISISTSF